MEITLQEIMSEVNKFHFMYGDLLTTYSDREKFKKVQEKCLEQYDKIRDLIKLYQQQAVIKELKTAIDDLSNKGQANGN